MGRILFTIHDVMNQANFSGTYTRVVDGKQVVVKKGWKKRRRSIAIAAGAIATTVGILALLAARKKPLTTPNANPVWKKPVTELTDRDWERLKNMTGDDWLKVFKEENRPIPNKNQLREWLLLVRAIAN